mmetsp:Transcript_15189/g.35103  ORF Transcript_15189/g.35103 Transcript_15189/m.35103 type:complete len:306 (+) Transcript_15189:666-1583(+)
MIRASLTTFRISNVVHMHGGAVRALAVADGGVGVVQPQKTPSQHGGTDARLLSSAAAASQRVRLPTIKMNRPDARLLSSAAASEELGSILTREINEETDASPEGTMPPEMQELYTEVSQKWTVLEGISGIGGGETGSGATVRMIRKEAGSKGAKIGIVFHCQDTEPDFVEMNESNLFEDGNDDEEEDEDSQAIRFGVTVSKQGKTVVLQCRVGVESLHVDRVTVRDGDTESVLASLANGEGTHAALYQGPDYEELAVDLQTAFGTYVEKECGVDETVSNFMLMFADYREQEEYVSWMKAAVEILD